MKRSLPPSGTVEFQRQADAVTGFLLNAGRVRIRFARQLEGN